MKLVFHNGSFKKKVPKYGTPKPSQSVSRVQGFVYIGQCTCMEKKIVFQLTQRPGKVGRSLFVGGAGLEIQY